MGPLDMCYKTPQDRPRTYWRYSLPAGFGPPQYPSGRACGSEQDEGSLSISDFAGFMAPLCCLFAELFGYAERACGSSTHAEANLANTEAADAARLKTWLKDERQQQ